MPLHYFLGALRGIYIRGVPPTLAAHSPNHGLRRRTATHRASQPCLFGQTRSGIPRTFERRGRRVRLSTGLLTEEDLIAVTGYRRGAEQLRALREQGYHPMPGADGHPRITWEALSARMSGLQPNAASRESNERLLNWASVKRRA